MLGLYWSTRCVVLLLLSCVGATGDDDASQRELTARLPQPEAGRAVVKGTLLEATSTRGAARDAAAAAALATPLLATAAAAAAHPLPEATSSVSKTGHARQQQPEAGRAVAKGTLLEATAARGGGAIDDRGDGAIDGSSGGASGGSGGGVSDGSSRVASLASATAAAAAHPLADATSAVRKGSHRARLPQSEAGSAVAKSALGGGARMPQPEAGRAIAKSALGGGVSDGGGGGASDGAAATAAAARPIAEATFAVRKDGRASRHAVRR